MEQGICSARLKVNCYIKCITSGRQFLQSSQRSAVNCQVERLIIPRSFNARLYCFRYGVHHVKPRIDLHLLHRSCDIVRTAKSVDRQVYTNLRGSPINRSTNQTTSIDLTSHSSSSNYTISQGRPLFLYPVNGLICRLASAVDSTRKLIVVQKVVAKMVVITFVSSPKGLQYSKALSSARPRPP